MTLAGQGPVPGRHRGPDQTVNEGDTVTLTGSFIDPDNAESQTYEWKVSDSNNDAFPDGTGLSYTFTPSDPGTYTVTFTVNRSARRIVVHVTAVAKQLVLTPTTTVQNAVAGASTTVDLGQLSVSEPGPFTVNVQWGDGQVSSLTESGSAALAVAHSYSHAGSYTISETVTDTQGESATVTLPNPVVVVDAPVVVTPVPVSVVLGSSTGSVLVATFTDPEGADPVADYTATIALGDPSFPSSTITYNNATGVFSVFATLSLDQLGSESITVTIRHGGTAHRAGRHIRDGLAGGFLHGADNAFERGVRSDRYIRRDGEQLRHRRGHRGVLFRRGEPGGPARDSTFECYGRPRSSGVHHLATGRDQRRLRDHGGVRRRCQQPGKHVERSHANRHSGTAHHHGPRPIQSLRRGCTDLTSSYSGFVNGDTPASLTTQPTLATTAGVSSHVSGSPYTITVCGAADSNYSISYVAGALIVTPAPLVITADDQTKAYGAALPTLTASFAGFVNGDTSASLNTAPTLTTTATAASHVSGNPYSISASGAVDSDYNISYVPGCLTVTPVALTITAQNQNKAYGAALPTLTASYAGFVNGDTSASLTTQPTLAQPPRRQAR